MLGAPLMIPSSQFQPSTQRRLTEDILGRAGRGKTGVHPVHPSDDPQADARVEPGPAQINYQECFRQIPLLLQWMTAEGQLIEVSNLWLQTLGYERTAVLCRPFSQFLAPGLQQQIQARSPLSWLEAAQQQGANWQMVHGAGHLLEMTATVVAQRDAQNRTTFLVLLWDSSIGPTTASREEIASRWPLALQIHDSILQLLYSLTLLAEGWRRMAKAGTLQQADEALAELGRIGGQALQELRFLIASLPAPTQIWAKGDEPAGGEGQSLPPAE
jgi:signal transduction histidine kinase